MKKIKIGFLPLYIKLYDDIGNGAKARPRLEPFCEKLACLMEKEGAEVVRNPFCRIKPEFEAAVKRFEEEGVDCIVTWHAAYSPSLECADALAGTALPVIVLDTTETYDFGPTQDAGEISYCHGIHGVMDMCNLLSRMGKPYAIAAGHISDSDVIERVVGFARAAVAAKAFSSIRVGSIGGSFDGMGDFIVTDEELAERFGVKVVYADRDELAALRNEVSEEELAAELAADRENFYEIEPVATLDLENTERNCLAVRHWMERHDLNAFTANFREIGDDRCGLTVMPFIEACKALSRGQGYAGEGDALTAALVGSLLCGFPGSSFVEIFCPDWKGGSLLLSHMGEFNPNLTDRKPGMKKINFVFGSADDPVVAYGRYKSGEATFLNLYRDGEGFRLLISQVEMLDAGEDKNFETRVRGWMKPSLPIAEFLETISSFGVTHHSALVYGATPEQLAFFAELLDLPCEIV